MMRNQAVEQELERFKCVGDDASPLTVLECRLVSVVEEARGIRIVPGARYLRLKSGERVRLIDINTFEVEQTGELITRV